MLRTVPGRNTLGRVHCPWVETHGYHRIVATRRDGATKPVKTIGGFHQPGIGPASTPSLVPLLRDGNPRVRELAVPTLRQIGSEALQ